MLDKNNPPFHVGQQVKMWKMLQYGIELNSRIWIVSDIRWVGWETSSGFSVSVRNSDGKETLTDYSSDWFVPC